MFSRLEAGGTVLWRGKTLTLSQHGLGRPPQEPTVARNEHFLFLPECVFLCPIRILRPAFCRCLPGRIFLERQDAVACPVAVSSNGKMPLLVRAYFPRTARCRCLPGRIFLERQNAVVCPDGILTNGGMLFLNRGKGGRKKKGAGCAAPFVRFACRLLAGVDKTSDSNSSVFNRVVNRFALIYCIKVFTT